jgi:hypothetical protein
MGKVKVVDIEEKVEAIEEEKLVEVVEEEKPVDPEIPEEEVPKPIEEIPKPKPKRAPAKPKVKPPEPPPPPPPEPKKEKACDKTVVCPNCMKSMKQKSLKYTHKCGAALQAVPEEKIISPEATPTAQVVTFDQYRSDHVQAREQRYEARQQKVRNLISQAI